MRPFDPAEEEDRDAWMRGRAEHMPNPEEDNRIEGEEAVLPKRANQPMRPNAAEVENHMLTHLPFRAWCPHCVRGKSRSKPHKRSEAAHDVPTLTLDYMFMHGSQRAGAEEGMPILVTRDLCERHRHDVGGRCP